MDDFEWELVAFLLMIGGLVALEEYAIRTKKIKPLSYFVGKGYRNNELNRYIFCGAWTGFCVWTIKHFFLLND